MSASCSKRLRPPFKIHGGKYYLAPWVVRHFPAGYQSMRYVEPYCGAANVLFCKDPSQEEIINDLDPGVVAVMRTLRDCTNDLVQALRAVRYRKEVFEAAQRKKDFAGDLERAVHEITLRRMSRGGLKKAFAWSKRLRGGRPGDENAWLTALLDYPVHAARLQNVYVFHKPALELIAAVNDKNTLLYVDPPYLPETRRSSKSYEVEMSAEDHVQLSNALKTFRGKVVISGYPSVLYNTMFGGWHCDKLHVPNHASQRKTKELKTETLWCNFSPTV